MTVKYGPNLGLLEGAALGEGHFSDLKKFLRGVDGLAQLQVLDKDLATPPGSPADGDRYIVAASPTGAWSGKAGQVARFTTDGNAWEFYPPKSGWSATCFDEPSMLYRHNGTAWIGVSLSPLTSGMIDVLQRNAQGTTIIDMGGNDYYMTEAESQHQAIFLLNTGTGKTCYLYDSILNPALITIVIYSATGVDFSCCAGGVVIAAAPLATYQLAYTYTTAVELDYARRDSVTGQLIDPIDASNITTGTINSLRIPTLNQNTTGSAATLTTARTIDGQSFNGSANITVIAPGTNAATSKATPVDADEIPLVDSAASNVLKKLTWANLKATLKTYFDAIYAAIAIPSCTFANLPSPASSYTYQQRVVTDANYTVWISNGTSWVPKAQSNLHTSVDAYARAPSGTISTGSSGNITFGTAAGRIFTEGLFVYLPSIATTPAITAGYYWCVMSSTTVGTLYSSKGGSAINFTVGAGYTGVTTAVQGKDVVTIKGGVMGTKGCLVLGLAAILTSNVNSKSNAIFLNGSAPSGSSAPSTTGYVNGAFKISASGTGLLVLDSNLIAANNGAPTYMVLDTTADFTLSYGWSTGTTATDWIIFSRFSVGIQGG